jgi:NAD(P)H dehydrogenase (quinone)
MPKALVAYYSKTGNTKRMAILIAAAIQEGGVESETRGVREVRTDELSAFDALVIGSPTYYGGMAAEAKKLLDDSVVLHGRLDGKVGGAFSSSRQIGGGNETTIVGILSAMLIHGMIIQGDWQGDHYGPVALGAPDDRTSRECRRFGLRIAELTSMAAGR